MGKGLDPVSMGLSAVSAITGMGAQQKAAKEASSANAYNKELARRALEIQKRLMGEFDAADKAGAFDPEAQIGRLEEESSRMKGLDRGGLASDWQRAGGAPGDTPFQRAVARSDSEHRKFLDETKLALRRQSWMDKFNALQGVAGSGQGVRPMSVPSVPSASSFLSSVQPFLAKPASDKAPSTPNVLGAPQQGAFSLGSGSFWNFKPSSPMTGGKKWDLGSYAG